MSEFNVNTKQQPRPEESRPYSECQLFFERKHETDMRELAAAISELATTVKYLAQTNDEQRRLLHGVNMDNGLVASVRDNKRDIIALKTLPAELRTLVLRWGFTLVGVQFTINVVFLTIIAAVVRSVLTGGAG